MRGGQEAVAMNYLDDAPIADCKFDETGIARTFEARKAIGFHVSTLSSDRISKKGLTFVLLGNVDRPNRRTDVDQ